MAARNTRRQTFSNIFPRDVLSAGTARDIDDDINVLVLGQTGVGKSTFINALANYIGNDSLEQAVLNEFQVLIASSFSYSSDDDLEDQMISIGEPDKHEQFSDRGQSCRVGWGDLREKMDQL